MRTATTRLVAGRSRIGPRTGLAVACGLLLLGAAACGSGSSAGAAAHTATTTTTAAPPTTTPAVVAGGAAPTTGTGRSAPAPVTGPAVAQQLATVQQQLAGVPGLLDQAATANQAADPDQARAAEGG